MEVVKVEVMAAGTVGETVEVGEEAMEVGVREEVKAVGGAAKAEEMEAEMEVAAKVTAVEGVTAAVTAAAAAKVVRFARQPSPY